MKYLKGYILAVVGLAAVARGFDLLGDALLWLGSP